MKFTEKNTLTELIKGTKPEFRLFLPDSLLQMLPEELRDASIDELKNHIMPWGAPFPAEPILNSANDMLNPEKIWKVHPLWKQDEFKVNSNNIDSVALMEMKSDLKGVCPAVIICPGGAYRDLSFHNEGVDIARKMLETGYRAFILNYRVAPNRYPDPQMDLGLAIKYLRANAALFQIDPNNIMILGFSAGGHLCASTAALRKEIEEKLDEVCPKYSGISIRPDKVCLCYPVISFLSEAHEESFQMLTGEDESLREKLSIEMQIDPEYPKTFVWTCEDDMLVPPSNAVRMGQALENQGIEYRLKVYPQGGHGCGLGEGTSATEWLDGMLEFFE